jgi:hypothetical protein
MNHRHPNDTRANAHAQTLLPYNQTAGIQAKLYLL